MPQKNRYLILFIQSLTNKTLFEKFTIKLYRNVELKTIHRNLKTLSFLIYHDSV